MMRRALYAGRFQPFHNGHMHAISEALERFDELIIGVCFIDSNFTISNPFTCGERIAMVWDSLLPEQRATCLITPLPDHSNNIMWMSNVRQIVPTFDAALTNNSLQAQLMRQQGIPVEPIPYRCRDRWSGVNVRACLGDPEEDWQALVPDGTRKVLTKIEGARRVATLSAAADMTHKGER